MGVSEVTPDSLETGQSPSPNQHYHTISRRCCVCHISYKTRCNIRGVLISTIVTSSILSLITVLLWTAGFYVQTVNQRTYTAVPTRCYVNNYTISADTCSYTTTLCTRRSSDIIVNVSDNVSDIVSVPRQRAPPPAPPPVSCTSTVHYYVCWRLAPVNIEFHQFINATGNGGGGALSESWTYTALDAGTFNGVYEAETYAKRLNNTQCWYKVADPASNILFAKPDPYPTYVAGIVFASLTGASLLIMLVCIVILLVART